jgi:V/A-type H+/Na+-transporting ATPase subunit E
VIFLLRTIIDHTPARAAGKKRKGFIMAKTLGDITSELTEKVLAPAKAEAENLLSAARAEAGRITAAAETDAERIREAARREADNLRKQMNVDLDTAARNFLIMVEERLEKAVVDPVIEENLKPLLSDREFLAKMIEELLIGFNRQGAHEHRIEILLPETKRAELETWFLQKFHDKASQPLDIRFTDKISFGFKIGVAGEGSHMNFSDGLVQVFSEFCSPRFRKHFFARKES